MNSFRFLLFPFTFISVTIARVRNEAKEMLKSIDHVNWKHRKTSAIDHFLELLKKVAKMNTNSARKIYIAFVLLRTARFMPTSDRRTNAVKHWKHFFPDKQAKKIRKDWSVISFIFLSSRFCWDRCAQSWCHDRKYFYFCFACPSESDFTFSGITHDSHVYTFAVFLIESLPSYVLGTHARSPKY